MRDSLLLQHFPVALDRIRPGFDKNATWVSALHSGNLGDIIYALPTCYLLGVNHIVLNVCVDPGFGGRVLTSAGAIALAPLLLEQRGIGRVTVIQSNVPWEYASPEILGVNYILDSFRGAASIPDLHLAYQHATPFGLHVDITKGWLTVGDFETELPREPYLAVNLTPRYRKYGRDYYEELFRGIPPENIIFIGVEADQAQRHGIQGSTFVTDNFLKLAFLIRQSKFFVGNASFPYAVAESLKVPRLVEVVNGANVYPVGDGGFPLHAFEVGSLRLRIAEALGISNETLFTLSTPGIGVGSPESAEHAEGDKQAAETVDAEVATAKLEEVVAALNERISSHEITISDLQAQLQVATEHVASANESIHEKAFLLSQKTEELSQKTDELESVRRDLAGIRQTASALQAQLQVATEHLASANESIQEKASLLSQKTDELESARQDLAEIRQTVSDLQARLQVAKHYVASTNSSIQEKTFLLSQKTDELESTRQDLAETRQTASDLQSRLQVAKQHVASANESIHEKTVLLAVKTEELSAKTTELSAKTDEFTRKVDELESARRDLREVRQRWAELDQEIHAMRISRAWRWAQRYRSLRLWRSRVASALVQRIRRSAYLLPRCLYWTLRGRLRKQLQMRANIKLVRQSDLFDPAYYLRKNIDVAASGIDPLEHFMRCGHRENRNPHPLFNVDYYTRLYLADSDDCENPLVHFLRLGAQNQNNPHPLFNTRFYLEQNPDVSQSGVNPLTHFLQHGVKEGRDPSPFFSISFYLDTYRDVFLSGLNPLEHFLEYGFREGRIPNPTFDIREFRRQYPHLLLDETSPLEAFIEVRDLAESGPIETAKPEGNSRRIYRSVLGEGRPEPLAPSGEIVPYVTHFFPAVPRAGNELRMHNMVRWLRGQRYRPLVIVAPLQDEEFSDTQLQQLEELSPDFVIVYRDGRVIASESAESLCSFDDMPNLSHDYAGILGEDKSPGSAASIAAEQSFCYNALISIVLKACAQLNPRLLIVNYVFMTRCFPLLPKKLIKVVDTIDVFSSVAEKVLRFGVRNTASLTSHDEAIMLHRADLIVAIQDEEEAELKKLAPGKRVITAGIDFPVYDTSIPDNRKVLFLASDNPRNVNGLYSLLRYAWPAVMREVPDAQLVIAGRISKVVEKLPLPQGVSLVGEVDSTHDLYKDCRLVVNPVVAGTGIKIKTVEALCHFRPLVTWPSGVEGIPARFRDFTPVARDWFEFAEVIQDFLRRERGCQMSDEMKRDITEYFSPECTYRDLGDAMRDYVAAPVGRQEANDDGTERTSAVNFQ